MAIIFVSYRRTDSQDVTGRIYDRLVGKYTSKQVFKDVDSIPLGVSFPAHIRQLLQRADTVLVIIGPNWLDCVDERGQRRLDDPNDFVRLEVELALRRKMPVIPVLVSNARMPQGTDLPPSMKGLTSRNGIPIRPDPDFNNDMARLFGGLDHLEKHLGARSGERSGDSKIQPANSNRQRAMADPPKARRNWRTWPLLIVCAILGVLAAAGLCWYCLPWGQSRSVPTPTQKKPSEESESKTSREIGPTYENYIGMKFAWIPPGTFMMGSPKSEAERYDNETQHKVTLTKGFYMGIHLVTQEQWQAVMGDNPSHFKGEKNLPVDSVSWDDCQKFIEKLRDKDKKPYRLPTEAEWEYACRAGTTTPFYFGETISTDQVNYDGNFPYGNGKKGVFREKTTPVGIFPANEWGLFDMHGNVWEWCKDCYDASYYNNSPAVDPECTSGSRRVFRGGCWSDLARHCRSAYRNGFDPGLRINYLGFRVALVPSGQ